MGNKGSNTTTQTSAPNPAAMAAYQDILNRAQSVASRPYQAYQGQLVAGLTDQQRMGIGNINANAGFASPYIQEAAGFARGAAQPLTADQIAQYQNPYTQQVVDATMEQFRHGNAQQQQQVLGNAAAQGALGGDRVKIAQAELAGQQQRSQAPVIAGLYSQGYGQALQTALGQQQQQAQAAYSLGNLGVAGQGAALQGAGAQLGAGGLEQQTEQARLNALYNQFQIEQAFPYQQAQWLAGIGTGVGSQMGGTSTTTGPAPNPWSQVAGLGMAAAGAYFGGPAGASAGYQIGTGLTREDGGRIPGFALGGTPYSGVAGYVPGIEITRGSGPPRPPGGQQQQDQGANSMVNGAMGLARAIRGRQDEQGSGDALGWTYQNGQWVPTYGGPNVGSSPPMVAPEFQGVGEVPYRYGGFVLPQDDRIEIPRGYDDGGEVGPPLVRGGFGGASFLPDFSPTEAGFFSAPSGLADARDDLRGLGERYMRERAQAGDFRPPAPTYPAGANIQTAGDPLATPVRTVSFRPEQPQGPVGLGDALPPIIAHGTQQPEYDDEDQPSALGFAPSRPPPPDAQETVDEAQGETGGFHLPGRGLLSPEAGQALMQAGFAMMASRSPFLGTAIGEGGLAGIQGYQAAMKAKADQALKKQHYDTEARRLDQMAQQAQDRLRETTRYHDILEKWRRDQLDLQRANQQNQGVPPGFRKTDVGLEPIPGGPHDPKTIKAETEARAKPDKAGKPLPTATQKDLGEKSQTFQQLDALKSGFKPEYAGSVFPKLGDLQNWVARQTGIGNVDAADWWSDYARYRNIVRNKLFGSALTAHEIAEWEKADINPGMKPDIVRKNIGRQFSTIEGAMKRRAASLVAQGYSQEAIEAEMGRSFGALGIKTPSAAKGSAPSSEQPSSAVAGKPAARDRFNELVGSGMSKQDAYKTLKEEGY